MKIHVITPMARYQNAHLLIEMLAPQVVEWHVIMDADRNHYLDFPQGWIHRQVLENEPGTFYHRCNRAINAWMDQHEWVDDDRYCFLNDDDAYEDGFMDQIRATEGEVVAVSMKRGMHIPADVPGERRHGTHTLVADPANMKVGHIGIEQMVISGRILKECRLPLTIAGDGEMLCYIASKNEVTYRPDLSVLFNYYEPGRWVKEE